MIENCPETRSQQRSRVLPRDEAEQEYTRSHAGRTRAGDGGPNLSLVPSVQAPRRDADQLPRIDLSDSRCYLKPELSLLDFNRRVLNEAMDDRTPLLERVKFLAIVAANLDSFFMEQMGDLRRQQEAGLADQWLLPECHRSVCDLDARRSQALVALRGLLQQEGIVIESYTGLRQKEKKLLRQLYYADIFPLLTPQSVGPAHPFPFLANLSLNVLASLRDPDTGEVTLARVKVPVAEGVPRFLRIGEGDRFVPLEEVVIHNLDLLFRGMQVVGSELFRVTRSASSQLDESQANDLVALVASELKERKFAPVVRLEVGKGMAAAHRSLLADELQLKAGQDVFEAAGLLAVRDLVELTLLNRPHLRDPLHEPAEHPLLCSPRSIFDIIRKEGELLLQHPYISFAGSVERFLREAAEDPAVRAIKMTLYRTAREGSILDSLLMAAQNGKHVSVIVEVKATFEEAANIRLAELLEEAGIHVRYGVVGLTTHGKVLLVVRQEGDRLRRYVHIATGNYHPETARLYSDVGLLTCDEIVAQDISELFNYLTTGFTPWRRYRAVMPAPKLLKRYLLMRIRRETQLQEKGRRGLIRIKVNALEDSDLIKALYLASQAGVCIQLYVRGTCALRPGVPGLSENISVVSTIGRFLEHARIYHFGNGGDDLYFISSADAVRHDLECRIEILCPVSAPSLVEELNTVFDLHQADRRSSWDMQPDGSYLQRCPAPGESAEGLQQMMMARLPADHAGFADRGKVRGR